MSYMSFAQVKAEFRSDERIEHFTCLAYTPSCDRNYPLELRRKRIAKDLILSQQSTLSRGDVIDIINLLLCAEHHAGYREKNGVRKRWAPEFPTMNIESSGGYHRSDYTLHNPRHRRFPARTPPRGPSLGIPTPPDSRENLREAVPVVAPVYIFGTGPPARPNFTASSSSFVGSSNPFAERSANDPDQGRPSPSDSQNIFRSSLFATSRPVSSMTDHLRPNAAPSTPNEDDSEDEPEDELARSRFESDLDPEPESPLASRSRRAVDDGSSRRSFEAINAPVGHDVGGPRHWADSEMGDEDANDFVEDFVDDDFASEEHDVEGDQNTGGEAMSVLEDEPILLYERAEDDDEMTEPHAHDREPSEPTTDGSEAVMEVFQPGDASTWSPWTLRSEVLDLLLEPLPNLKAKGSIYAVKVNTANDTPMVKIGYTTRPVRTRLREIAAQQGNYINPESRFFISHIPILQLQRLEKLIHGDLNYFQRDLKIQNGRVHKTHREYFTVDLNTAERTIKFWYDVIKDIGLEPGQELDEDIVANIRRHPALAVERADVDATADEPETWNRLNSDHCRRENIWNAVFRRDCGGFKKSRDDERSWWFLRIIFLLAMPSVFGGEANLAYIFVVVLFGGLKCLRML